MLQQLESGEDWILRAEALHFLATHRVTEAMEAIRGILDDSEDNPWLRGRALVAMAEIDGKIEDPSPFVSHEHAELRAAAAELLERFPSSASPVLGGPLLTDSDPRVRSRALAAHARQHAPDAWAMIDPATRSPRPDELEFLARALVHLGEDSALARLRGLVTAETNRPHLRKIVRGVGDMEHPFVISLLVEMAVMTDCEDGLFGTIISALQIQDGKQLVTVLRSALKSEDTRWIRSVAKIMTVLVRDPELGDFLRRALAGIKDVDTVKAGLVALGSKPMKPDRYHALFTTFLDHEDVDVRTLAIRCLAHCESTNLFDQFRERMDDEEPVVVQAALEALLRAPVATAPRGQLVDYLQAPLLGQNEGARDMAYRLLGQVGGQTDFQPAMAMLGHLLRGNDDTLREAAAEALGKIAPLDSVGDVVRAQGYMAKWRVLGTFLNDEKHSGFDEELPPESGGEIDFETSYQAKYVWLLDGRRLNNDQERLEREIIWAEASLDQTNGKLVMSAQLPPPGSYAVGFAVADFEADAGREVFVTIDGDDAFRVWLNGEKIADKVAAYLSRQPSVAEQAATAVTLRGGANRLLVKSANIDHDWWVRVRFTDKTGKPIELLTP